MTSTEMTPVQVLVELFTLSDGQVAWRAHTSRYKQQLVLLRQMGAVKEAPPIRNDLLSVDLTEIGYQLRKQHAHTS